MVLSAMWEMTGDPGIYVTLKQIADKANACFDGAQIDERDVRDALTTIKKPCKPMKPIATKRIPDPENLNGKLVTGYRLDDNYTVTMPETALLLLQLSKKNTMHRLTSVHIDEAILVVSEYGISTEEAEEKIQQAINRKYLKRDAARSLVFRERFSVEKAFLQHITEKYLSEIQASPTLLKKLPSTNEPSQKKGRGT